jgi:hypothetical protein
MSSAAASVAAVPKTKKKLTWSEKKDDVVVVSDGDDDDNKKTETFKRQKVMHTQPLLQPVPIGGGDNDEPNVIFDPDDEEAIAQMLSELTDVKQNSTNEFLTWIKSTVHSKESSDTKKTAAKWMDGDSPVLKKTVTVEFKTSHPLDDVRLTKEQPVLHELATLDREVWFGSFKQLKGYQKTSLGNHKLRCAIVRRILLSNVHELNLICEGRGTALKLCGPILASAIFATLLLKYANDKKGHSLTDRAGAYLIINSIDQKVYTKSSHRYSRESTPNVPFLGVHFLYIYLHRCDLNDPAVLFLLRFIITTTFWNKDTRDKEFAEFRKTTDPFIAKECQLLAKDHSSLKKIEFLPLSL